MARSDCMVTWYVLQFKQQSDLAEAQSMANSSAAQVGEMAKMSSEIRKKDQVGEMFTWLRDSFSSCIRYPASIGAVQNPITVNLLSAPRFSSYHALSKSEVTKQELVHLHLCLATLLANYLRPAH